MTTAAELVPDRRQNKGSESVQILPRQGVCWVDHRKPKAKTMSRAERDARKLSEVIEILTPYLDPDVLADLYQRAEESTGADGYPSGSSGQSDIHGGRGGDPTEHVVELRAGGKDDERDTWKELHDTILTRIVEFQGELTSIHGSARLLRKSADVVLNAGDKLKGRVSALQGDCLRCQKPVSGVGADKMRGGLCHSCSNAYYDERTPGQTVAAWLGTGHPLANRRPVPVASADEVPRGVTWSS